MKQPILIGALALLAATTVFAGSEKYVATLAQPVAAKVQFISNGNAWTCEGTSCFLTSIPSDAGSVQACRDLQRKAGELTAYGSGDKPFDADKLAECNVKH